MNYLIVIVTIIVMSSSTLSAGEIYKWIDENGKVHYSDRPIDKNAKKLEIKNDISPKQQKAAIEKAKQLIKVQRQHVAIEIENMQEKQQLDIEKEKKAAELAQACKEARQAVKILEYQAPVFEKAKDGSQKFLTDEQRQKELENLKKQIDQHCNQN